MHDGVDVGQSLTSASLAGLVPCFSKAKRLAFVGSCAFALHLKPACCNIAR